MKTCTLNDILFDVEKVNFEEKFGIQANSDYSHAIIGNINGKETILNVCSDRYELVPNAEIFLPIREQLLNAGIKFSEKYEQVNNARFYASYRIEESSMQVGQGNDIIFPEMRVSHSYNGLTKYSISFGYYRLICTNGLVIPVKGKEKFNFDYMGKHTISINSSIDMLKEKINYFIVNSKPAIEGFNSMYDNWIDNPNDRIIEVLNASGIINVKTPESTVNDRLDKINTIMNIEATKLDGEYINDIGNTKVNDWLIYNAVNSYVHNDDNNKKVPEQRFAYDNKVIDFMLS